MTSGHYGRRCKARSTGILVLEGLRGGKASSTSASSNWLGKEGARCTYGDQEIRTYGQECSILAISFLDKARFLQELQRKFDDFLPLEILKRVEAKYTPSS